MPRRGANGTQSVERAITLLREIATFGKSGARLSDLILRSRIEYPTAHRILKALVEQDLVAKDPTSRRYFLGQLVYELGLGVEPPIDMRLFCDAMTSRLADATGDTIFLNIRSRHDVVCIDRKEGSFPIKTLVFDIGNRRPLGIGAAGIALLMSYGMDEVQEIVRANSVRFARYGKLNADQIVTLVRRAKDVGYVATDDVVVPGVRAVCLPFGGHGRLPPSAISVATVAARLPRSRVAELLSIMEEMIRKLGASLGPQSEMSPSPLISRGLTRPVHA
ncbi:MAG TPA: IclR family transcriptional regulator [Vicinamibacterales bacterium]|nr:IclR family transcriptional regulator [Vicinamibacterales bacterium]